MLNFVHRRISLTRMRQPAVYLVGSALALTLGLLVAFLSACVGLSICGPLQEPRGFIALASLYMGHRTGSPPLGSDCACRFRPCPILYELTGTELPEDILALRPPEINPPFVRKQKFFPASVFLEAHWEQIRDDALCLIRQAKRIPTFGQIDPRQSRLANAGAAPWHVFTLKAFGQWVEQNAALVPGTSRLLKLADDDISSAIFSILEPNKSIPEHCGPMKSVWRYHLGLVVPDRNPPYIQVEHFKYTWKAGQGVLFDDTFHHEVVNTQSQWRVVLFLDIYRKDISHTAQRLHRLGELLAHASPSVQRGVERAITPNMSTCPLISRPVPLAVTK